MSTTTLGVIGSGMVGAGVARRAVDAGLRVVLANSRGPESLAGLVAELGGRARRPRRRRRWRARWSWPPCR